MADRIMQYLNKLGAPKWTDEEQAFAKTNAKIEGYDEIGLSSVDYT